MKIYVVVVGIKHSGNLGALARISQNFNVEDIILVEPMCEVDDHAYERATHARRYLDEIKIVNHLNETRKFVDVLIALSARKGGISSMFRSALPLNHFQSHTQNMSGNLGIVLGRENFGLSNQEIDECDFIITIPAPGQNNVFNISHAASIVLWEICKTFNLIDGDLEEPMHKLPSESEKRAFLGYLQEILPFTWVPVEKHDAIVRVFTTIFGRALVTKREINTLIGTLRGINRRISEGPPPWEKSDTDG